MYGPFLVTEQLCPVTFQIWSIDGGHEKIVHVERLKRYQDEGTDDEVEDPNEEDGNRREGNDREEEEWKRRRSVEVLEGLIYSEGYHPMIKDDRTFY